jgi:ribonuclease Z
LISSDEGDVLVDAGDGTLRDLLELDYDFERLKAIAITHGHFDHVGGLWTLLGFLRMTGRTNDLFLIAPTSCSEIKNLVKSFITVYNDTMPFKIILKELSNEKNLMWKEWRFKPFLWCTEAQLRSSASESAYQRWVIQLAMETNG